MHELRSLRAALDGELITPDSAAYEAARRPALARFHHVRPIAVVRCASTRDVTRTLAFARHSGAHVVPRGGGHCFAGRSSTAGLVLDLSRTARLRRSAVYRVPADATAFVHRSERFLLGHVACEGDRWLDRSWALAHAFASGRVYPNFPDPGLDDWATAYYGGNAERLRAVKRGYDPGRLFRFPQAI